MKDTPFTEARLLSLYDRVAEAEDAIPRLRRFVLDLAVRGKLVPQDARDEPASVLLERIEKEKARLVKAGELKLGRPSKGTSEAQRFPLPSGWRWSCLEEMCLSVTDGDHLPPPKSERGVPFLVIGDVRSGTVNYVSERMVPQSYFDALDPIRKPMTGDILYTLVGSFGIPVLVKEDTPFCVQRHIGIIRPSSEMDIGFLYRLLASEFVFRQADACATGIAQKTVPLSGLRAIALPLPPLAEQNRIVTKVEELMALLDRLEAARAAREETRTRLTAATLSRLTEADTDTPTAARFALQTIPALTTRPDQIKTLRQTILNLAVRGKLVKQDAGEEPALALLERIENERAQLAKAKLLSPPKPLPRPLRNDLVFGVPAHWEPVNMAAVLDELQTGPFGSALHQSDYVLGGTPVINPASMQNGKIVPADRMAVGPKTMERLAGFQLRSGDIVMARRGEMGRCALVTEREAGWLCGTGSLVLRFSKNLHGAFIVMLIGSPTSREYLGGSAVGATMQNLNQAILLQLPFGLPPLAEQHRIVAKVDELMSLCDRLERALQDATTTRAHLLDATLRDALVGAQEAA